MLRVVVAAFHLIALGLGLGAVLTRGNVLREPLSKDSLRRAFRADNLWGAAAALWVVTGLWRAFGTLEKGGEYYLHNYFFGAKMAAFLLILLLEIGPMLMLIRWRAAMRRGEAPQAFASESAARRIATLSHVEALLVVLMVFAAAAMARGYGLPA